MFNGCNKKKKKKKRNGWILIYIIIVLLNQRHFHGNYPGIYGFQPFRRFTVNKGKRSSESSYCLGSFIYAAFEQWTALFRDDDAMVEWHQGITLYVIWGAMIQPVSWDFSFWWLQIHIELGLISSLIGLFDSHRLQITFTGKDRDPYYLRTV